MVGVYGFSEGAVVGLVFGGLGWFVLGFRGWLGRKSGFGTLMDIRDGIWIVFWDLKGGGHIAELGAF